MVTIHLGVDGGGTSTRAVLVHEDGTCVGYGVSGGGNPVSWGPAAAMREIEKAVRAAQRYAHIGGGHSGPSRYGSTNDSEKIGQAVLALAGGISSSAHGTFVGELKRLGVTGETKVTSDLLGMFSSGTAADSGYALVSGTGAAAIRVESGDVATSADGLGWMLGDAGSGFWIGFLVVRSALASLEGRGPATVMAQPVLEHLGIPSVDPGDTRGLLAILRSAVEMLYRWRPVELAALAPIAFTAALRDDDLLAWKILNGARDELNTTLGATLQPDLPGAVVIGGSVATKLPKLQETIIETVRERTGEVPTLHLVPDGAVGAATLALRSAGIRVDDAIHRRIVETLNQLRQQSGN